MTRSVKTGQLTPVALDTPSVAQTSVEIASTNATRAGLYVFNPNATNTLWIAPGSTVAAANGEGSVAVQPLQGIWFIDIPFTNSMNAVFNAGTGSVTVWEMYE